MRCIVVSLVLALTLCLRPGHGAERAYTFTIVDIPLHFTFGGRPRDDIVRFTDLNTAETITGTDFAHDGFLVTPTQQVLEIRCPGDVREDDNTTIHAINNTGTVVGDCITGTPDNRRSTAFLRTPDGTITLLDIPDATGSWAFGINDLGDIVGEYFIAHFPTAPPEWHGFLWQQGVVTRFDAPFPGVGATTLLAMNTAGEIIGTARPSPSAPLEDEVAFVYTSATQTFTLLTVPGATFTPLDINNQGQVLGVATAGTGPQVYILYEAGTYVVITDASGIVLDPADPTRFFPPFTWGLNDAGTLVGFDIQRVPCPTCPLDHGFPAFREVLHSFRAVPTPPLSPCPVALRAQVYGDFNGDGETDTAGVAVDGALWRQLRGEGWQQLPGYAQALVVGDVNGDGRDDLAAVGTDTALWLMTNGRDWESLHGSAGQLVAGDFEANGQISLVARGDDTRLWIWHFGRGWQQLPGFLTSMAAGDFLGLGFDQLAGTAMDDVIWVAPRLGAWQPLNGRLKTLVGGHFTGQGHAELAGVGEDASIWHAPFLGAWHQLPGNLTSIEVHQGSPGYVDALAGRDVAGTRWWAPTLGAWVRMPGPQVAASGR